MLNHVTTALLAFFRERRLRAIDARITQLEHSNDYIEALLALEGQDRPTTEETEQLEWLLEDQKQQLAKLRNQRKEN